MSPEPRFRRDLYHGTAPYYHRYRLAYPEVLLDDARRRLAVPEGGRLLDLGCGTGQIALPLVAHFAEVVAVDQEREAIEAGRAAAGSRGVRNIRWMEGSAEEVRLAGVFDLVTIGNAFHRFDRRKVAERIHAWLRPGGGVAQLWSDTPWHGDRPWQRVLKVLLLDDWIERLGAGDRIPAGLDEAMAAVPNEQVLRDAGFELVGHFELIVEHEWRVESLVGFTYSTSFLNRNVLGEQAEGFEADLAARLLAVDPGGRFHQDVSFGYLLAKRGPP